MLYLKNPLKYFYKKNKRKKKKKKKSLVCLPHFLTGRKDIILTPQRKSDKSNQKQMTSKPIQLGGSETIPEHNYKYNNNNKTQLLHY